MSIRESNLILIIDFGSQYTQLIARRVREAGVYSVVKSNKLTKKDLVALNPKGIILSGGPDSVTSKTVYKLPKYLYELNVPLLGICYGMQLLAHHFKGKVKSSSAKEFGHSVFSLSLIHI